MSYGGKVGSQGDDIISYGFYFVLADQNLIVSGRTKNSTNDDGNANTVANYDGFVMRLTPLGFVQWVSYLSAKKGYNEYVGNIAQFITPSGTAIMGVFHSLNTPTNARVNAIVKLTYDEGKLIWAKEVVYADFIHTPPLTVTKHSSWMIDSDPTF